VKELRARARRVIRKLHRLHADADCALHHGSALELLAATILSAQCTDERVNMVTPALFERFPDAAAYAEAESAEMESLIRSTGFYRNKARSLIALGQALVERHDGEVPDSMEALVELPGVGRKTANVVLGTWFDRPAIFVDTHVKRLANRLGWTAQSDPLKIEMELQRLLPEAEWTFTAHALIWHGRKVCKARKPACDDCGLREDCPFPQA
jgi:endonuclease-3